MSCCHLLCPQELEIRSPSLAPPDLLRGPPLPGRGARVRARSVPSGRTQAPGVPTWPFLSHRRERRRGLGWRAGGGAPAGTGAPGAHLPGHLPHLVSPDTRLIFLRRGRSQFLLSCPIPSTGLPRLSPTTLTFPGTKFVRNVALRTGTKNGPDARPGFWRSARSKTPLTLAHQPALTRGPLGELFRSLNTRGNPLAQARHSLRQERGPLGLGREVQGPDNAQQLRFALGSPSPRRGAPVPGLQPALRRAVMECAESMKAVYSGLIERVRVNCLP